MQLVSGVRLSAYWLSTYLFDVFLFGILTTSIMATFMMYGRDAAKVFVGEFSSFFATLCLTFFYGTSALPFSYLLSRGFNNHTTAQISIMGIFFTTGFVAVNAHFIMISLPDTKEVSVHVFVEDEEAKRKKLKKGRITGSTVTPTYGSFRRSDLNTAAGSARRIFLRGGCSGTVQIRGMAPPMWRTQKKLKKGESLNRP